MSEDGKLLEVEKACAAELAEFFYPANPPYRSKEAMAEDMALVIARHFLTALHTPDHTALLREAAEAIRPFVELATKRDAIYRRRGGNPDAFPDGHPAYEITGEELPAGVWRRAAALLARLEKEAGK